MPSTVWSAGFKYVALSSAILAALAALAALMSGHHANEAMIEQIQSSDKWGYYQAKGIKAAVLNTRIELLQALGKPISKEDQDKADQYSDDQDKIQDEAKEKEVSSKHHLEKHMVLARAVTLFQVAIAISAISILSRKRRYWILSLLFGGAGLVFLGLGL